MKQVKEAKKYAKTLINIVGIEETPQALVELGVVENLMTKNGDFRNLLLNPRFTDADRADVMKQVASRIGISDRMLKFITHLTEIRVIAALSQIIKIATAIYLEKKRQAKAVVHSPVELSESHAERLRASLKKLTERDVDLEFVMEPSLLGGVMVKVGSTMYDSSIKGQLRLLKDELIKG